ncbi:MAG: hypothetical protein OEW00_13640, partial [candidate division Zixibacteria bacterium]|nr:hypothetical protein [candidate division Zixibacteria bacterium]
MIASLTIFFLTGPSVRASAITGEAGVVHLKAHVSWDEIVSLSEAMTAGSVAEQKIAPSVISLEPWPVAGSDYTPPVDVLRAPGLLPESSPLPITVDFQALADNNAVIPPDAHGTVGDDYVMVMANTQVRI